MLLGIKYKSRTYATFNPADKGGNLVLSNGNKTLATDGTGNGIDRIARTTVQLNILLNYYWEMTGTSLNPEAAAGGIATHLQPLGDNVTDHFMGDASAGSVSSPYWVDGKCYYNNGLLLSAGSNPTGNIVGMIYDGPNSTFKITLDGITWQTVMVGLGGTPFFVAASVGQSTCSVTLNAGPTFHYNVPSGSRAGVWS